MSKKKLVKKKSSEGSASKGKGDLRVSDLTITDEFKTIVDSADGRSAAEELMKIPRGIVLVVDEDNKPCGVITAREFLTRIVDGDNPTAMSVNNLMNTDIMEIKYSALLDNVVPKVTERDPYAVVVTDKEGNLKGYFSPKDYQEALAKINYI
ncbi:MAG: CBS domain-containing protein [Thermoplasmata archaeon]|nr:CBS domain-containing protein [Thermoplasmata archaeon]